MGGEERGGAVAGSRARTDWNTSRATANASSASAGVGSPGLAWVSEPPGVLRQNHCAVYDGFQRAIEGQARLAHLLEVVRLAEGPVVPGQECLERFLCGLLGVERHVPE